MRIPQILLIVSLIFTSILYAADASHSIESDPRYKAGFAEGVETGEHHPLDRLLVINRVEINGKKCAVKKGI